MVPDIVELRKDLGFVEDLARFSENILSEKQIRAKYHLFDESAWVALGVDEAFVEAVELERTRRIRSGATKRELAQLRVVKAPEVLGKILEDPKANAKHRIDASKALDSLAGFVSERSAFDQERVIIRIDLGADTRAQGLPSAPGDVLHIEADARPVDAEGRFVAPQERAPLIASEQFEPEVIPEKRGRGRPRGSKTVNRKPEVCPGFDV